MHPVLFKFGKLTIHSYGFFVALGFIVGIFLAKLEAKKLGEDQEKIMDLCFYILMASILGARLFYVFTNHEMFLSDPLEVLRIWNGGLVFYGGFIGALVTVIVYIKKKKILPWKTVDILTPSLALGYCIARLGCFSAGCCYGKACDLP